jgi:predicted nuclease of predicted toxin-antitoxin system
MKIKLDENIPHRLVRILVYMGHEVDTVQEEGLAGHDDTTSLPMIYPGVFTNEE